MERGEMRTGERTPEDQVEEWERDGEIRSLMSTLPRDQQRALRLRYWQQRSVAEVALEMGRNENAAKQLLHRAIRNLRLRLKEGTKHG
jgi:RNA polymerase sigma factor (sigma-70 family)